MSPSAEKQLDTKEQQRCYKKLDANTTTLERRTSLKMGSGMRKMQQRQVNKQCFNTSELLNLPERDLVPEDAIQTDLLPILPPSGALKVLLLQWTFSQDIFPLTELRTLWLQIRQKSL